MTELDALMVLNAVPGLGSARIKKLLDQYGSAQRIFSLSESALMADRIIPANVIQNIFHFPKDNFLKNEYNLITPKDIKIITLKDENYPVNLREIAGAPVILYVQGRIPQDNKLSVAIVGSRQASLYGITVAEQFAARLAELGLTIVSGMARGIDTAAHRAALRAKGSTMAVMGCGLAHIYPPENKDLYRNIVEHGAVISEFPMETPPAGNNFPARNRIISGLSLGVVVVEAALKSGALITADFALEQGREVFAIPGKVDNPNSRGVHNLIKQGAKLATCVEDILEEIEPQLSPCLKEQKKFEDIQEAPEIPAHLSDNEKLVYQYIKNQPVHIDALAEMCHVGISILASVLFQLEIKKLVRQLPGKMFVR